MTACGSEPLLRPRRPSGVPEFAEACLRALVDQGLGHAISLGGGVGLLHYCDYRSTHDVDAWWAPTSPAEQRARVVGAIVATLGPWGEVTTRAWGDVVSVELRQEGKLAFSFQVADRTVVLEEPAPAPWIDVLLDSFADLVASKMVALVERGAPRDFRDIYTLCQSGLTTPQACWDLWARRQQLVGSDIDRARARLAVETHLARIAQHRPLSAIEDGDRKQEAEQVRHWIPGELLHVLDG